MGASGSELKRVRQSKKHNLHNRHYKSMMKTAIKNVLVSDKKDAPELLKTAIATIDRIATKGIIHNNNAARQKSKITKFVNNL